jgi:hypothetical protein
MEDLMGWDVGDVFIMGSGSEKSQEAKVIQTHYIYFHAEKSKCIKYLKSDGSVGDCSEEWANHFFTKKTKKKLKLKDLL